MPDSPAPQNQPCKKKWQTPSIVVIDSSQPMGGANPAFVERGAKSGKYYIARSPAASHITVKHGSFDLYQHS